MTTQDKGLKIIFSKGKECLQFVYFPLQDFYLFAAMPSGSGPSSVSVGMDMGGLSQNINPNLGMGLGSGLQGNVMHGNLGGNTGIGIGQAGSLGSDNNPTLGRSGMGLMDRPTGMPMNMGLSTGVQNPIRNLGGSDSLMSSSSSSMGNFSGTPFTSQRNVVQISNVSGISTYF